MAYEEETCEAFYPTEVDSELDYRYHLNAVKMEHRAQEVFFQVKEYLYQEGVRDLFTELDLEDVMQWLYDPAYIRLIKQKDPDFLR